MLNYITPVTINRGTTISFKWFCNAILFLMKITELPLNRAI